MTQAPPCAGGGAPRRVMAGPECQVLDVVAAVAGLDLGKSFSIHGALRAVLVVVHAKPGLHGAEVVVTLPHRAANTFAANVVILPL